MKKIRTLIGLALLACALHAGAETLTRTVAYEYDAVGRLTKETLEPDLPNDCQQTTLTYDTWGNRSFTRLSTCAGAGGNTVQSAFTPRDAATDWGTTGRFAITGINAYGHTETRAYDTRFGGVTSLTGPNNLTSSWIYDTFGRKTRETRPDGTYTTWTYLLCSMAGYCPSSVGSGIPVTVVTEQAFAVNAAANGPRSRQYLDKLGRVIRSETQGFNGTAIYVDTEYNNQGQPARVSAPYYAGATVVWTTFAYDSLNRVTTKSRPDPAATGGVATTTYTYNGPTTSTTNAKNQTKTAVTGARGKITQVTDAASSTITYGWDALDQLTSVNAAGSITTIAYSKRGFKTAMNDPAMGAWIYAYNAFGELVSQRDSLNQTVTIQYDLLGRMVQRNEPDLVSNWSYDKKFDQTSCGKGLGKLCEATANNGYRRVHSYDTLGRPSTTSTVLDDPANPATVTEAFDSNTGKITTKTWPTGYQAAYAYNSYGYLQSVTGGANSSAPTQVSYTIQAMDAQGRVQQWLAGNQLVTVNSFDATTNRLTGIQVGTNGAIQNHAYTWDAIGNLTGRNDNTTGVGTQESFSYDAVNRLTLASILSNAVSPPQLTEVMYDARDNITYKSDVGTYWYDPARPNRMTNVTLAAPTGATVPLTGTRVLTYAFDDTKAGAQSVNGTTIGNGNLEYTVSQDSTNSRHTVRYESYTSFNMPNQFVYGNFVTSTSSTADRTLTFVYGPEHQRIKQNVALSGNGTSAYKSGNTWYLNGIDSLGLTYEKEVTTGGLTEHKHYVTAGGETFALYTTRSGTLGSLPAATTSYLHKDHLGSVSTITDSAGTVTERLAYDPWGKRRQTNGTRDTADAIVGQNTERGYTMHEHLDEVGVIHMNARIYDPLIGRFMSPDDVVPNPTDLKAFNRYSYVTNNPLRLVDPTGHNYVDDTGTGSTGGGMEGGDWGPAPDPYSDKIGTDLSYPEWDSQKSPADSPNGTETQGNPVSSTDTSSDSGPSKRGSGVTLPNVTVDGRQESTPCEGGSCARTDGSLLAWNTNGAKGREDGWDSKSGKAPNDRGREAENLARAELETRGYKYVGRQVFQTGSSYARTYDLLMRAPDGQYVPVEVKSTIADVFTVNKQQLDADISLLANGARLINPETGNQFDVKQIIYIGVDFSSNLAADFNAWRTATGLEAAGGKVIYIPIGPKQ